MFVNAYRLIFARRCFYRLNRLLYNLSLSGLGVLNYENDKVSGEYRFLQDYFKDLENGVVLDVGANVGNYSKRIKEIESSTTVMAFEPHPRTFEKLQLRANELGFKAYNVAVGASGNGQLTLYDYAEKDGSHHASLYRGVIESIHKGEAIGHDVNVISLDNFVIDNGIDRVHLLKIDTEGYELEVMKGFLSFIKAGRVDAIHFEFNEMNVISRVFFKDFWEMLPSFDFFRMLPDGIVRIAAYSPVYCEIFAYQNIVAIRKGVHDHQL
jgi:FkbM family methyltransferase